MRPPRRRRPTASPNKTKLLTLEEKREVANATFILEELILPGLLQEECVGMAETGVAQGHVGRTVDG